MNKLIYIAGGAVVGFVVAGSVFMAAPTSSTAPVPAPVPSETAGPFAGLQRIFDEEGPALGLTEAEIRAEDDFLRLNSGRQSDTETSAPLKNAQNQPAVNCPKVPEAADREFLRGNAPAAARRWIYSVVRAEHVIATQDCSCTGKSAPFAPVYAIERELNEQHGEGWERIAMRDYQQLFYELRDKVEAMCGGKF